ncbi:energy transducer TonB [Paraburkholderia silviterrae]|uniref:Energy transducer TonB n=1 Tax=Paraburkholderia silviterrae TaxID=2528715 RepID=A0A4R5MCP9_9BURK|nr:energy transducer TonB [Paraburkholderia silviterrae]TDG24736.1 energy transducer TonB [Paraburkholderia silviterrae]
MLIRVRPRSGLAAVSAPGKTSACKRLLQRFVPFLLLALASACTITPPPRPLLVIPPQAINSAALDDYRAAVAKRIVERNPSYVLQGTPQAMLRSLVVVSFTVNRDGQITKSSVYRSNGDYDAEATALVTLRRSAPLPPPPTHLLNSIGQIELFEDWLFNDNGKFQLRTLASPQAQNFN